MNHTFDGECKACKEMPLYPIKEYIHGIIDFIRWDQLIAMFCLWFFTLAIFGWWGLPLAICLHSAFFTMQGGATGGLNGELHREYKQINCVAGKLNCEICHNDINYGNK